jgi:hypothetical protein
VSVSLERLARNQVLFREVNERLVEVAESWGSEPLQFLCECSGLDCKETISLDTQQYEGVRSSPNRFVIAPGHEIPEIERVVEANDRFTLVEKVIGADLAVETDPRGHDGGRRDDVQR